MYKLVRQFSLLADTVRHILLPPRLSALSCFLIETAVRDKYLPAETVHVILLPVESDCPHDSAFCRE